MHGLQSFVSTHSGKKVTVLFTLSLQQHILLTSAFSIIIIIIINLIYIAQFDTNGILTALYIVITYIQKQYVHV